MWQKKRAAASKTFCLTQKNTYIFPTRYGFLLAAIAFLMGVAATNYQNNLIFIACFMVIAIGLIGIILTYNNLVGLTITIHPIEPVFVNNSINIDLSLHSDKSHSSVSLGFKNSVMHSLDIFENEDNRIRLKLPTTKRGQYFIPAIRCQTIFPMGFLQAWGWVYFDSQYFVFPEPKSPPDSVGIDQANDSEYSEQYKLGGNEFYGVRAYQKGDSFSHIHWKKFAQTEKLHVKSFVQYLSDPEQYDFEQYDGFDLEERLSFLTFLILSAEKNGQSYGLILPTLSIPIGQGEQHLFRCLCTLACYQQNKETV